MTGQKTPLAWVLPLVGVLAACHGSADLTPAASPATPASNPSPPLSIVLDYPQPDTTVVMGDPMSVIIQAFEPSGGPVDGAHAQIQVEDPAAQLMVVARMRPGRDGIYRASSWLIPHRTAPGMWTVRVVVRAGDASGEATGTFQVEPSISERLLSDYGFWAAPPTLGGIQSSLAAERGDARNGLIRMGGAKPASHVLPEAWIEIQWRSGQAVLSKAEDVRRFLLDDVGDFGVTPIRAIGDAKPFEFQGRPGWMVTMRGQFANDDIQWVVFNAPEVDKTYAIGTTVVLPPTGVNAHALIRDSFEIPAGVAPNGTAPEPLPDLLSGPIQLSPEIGASFEGTDASVQLEWTAVKTLAPDELYQVTISTNYDEASPFTRLTTRETQLDVPVALFHRPNCGVFNWQVQLMKVAGEGADGSPQLEPVSYSSLYAYFLWKRTPGSTAEFLPLCPNNQY